MAFIQNAVFLVCKRAWSANNISDQICRSPKNKYVFTNLETLRVSVMSAARWCTVEGVFLVHSLFIREAFKKEKDTYFSFVFNLKISVSKL